MGSSSSRPCPVSKVDFPLSCQYHVGHLRNQAVRLDLHFRSERDPGTVSIRFTTFVLEGDTL
jgi:hypothetical protein